MAGIQRGIVLLAHGSRDPLWSKPVEAVAQRIRLLEPQALVACAYLELQKPGIDDAAHALIAHGAAVVRVLPLFLGMGKHAREDLPVLMTDLRARYPTTSFELATTVGEDARLIDLLAKFALA
jgi:sirohydrochlorin cobaltochelatase